MKDSRLHLDNKDEVPLKLNEDEITLLDILRFIKGAYKTIVLVGVAGLVAAIAYLAITPKQYGAIAQIAMAQISVANNNNNNNSNSNGVLNVLGASIEEPSLLIARLSSPTSFTPQVKDACGVGRQPNSGSMLAQAIKLAPLKGVANVVELKTIGDTPEVASACAQAVFELIKTTQAQIVAPYIADSKIKLEDDIERLVKAKEIVIKADKSGSAMGAAYLSTKDEIRFLLDEIAALKNVVTSSQSGVTRLIAPIYVSDIPIAPKKRVVLLVGLFGGLVLGLLIALACQLRVNLIVDAQEQKQRVQR